MNGFSTRLSFAFSLFFLAAVSGKDPAGRTAALRGAKVEIAPLATATKATPAAPRVRSRQAEP